MQRTRDRESTRERRRRAVAGWFVAWGALALPAAAVALVWALGFDPLEGGGGSPCTGPLGAAFGLGLKVFGFLLAAALAWSGVLHAFAGGCYLRRGGTRLVRFACWWDAQAWLLIALTVGLALGPLGVALPLALAAAHVRAAFLFPGATDAVSPLTFVDSSRRWSA